LLPASINALPSLKVTGDTVIKVIKVNIGDLVVSLTLE
jgi:hypothetical protein